MIKNNNKNLNLKIKKIIKIFGNSNVSFTKIDNYIDKKAIINYSKDEIIDAQVELLNFYNTKYNINQG